MQEIRNAYNILVSKTGVKNFLEDLSTGRWEGVD
jgi:hypothetical protein